MVLEALADASHGLGILGPDVQETSATCARQLLAESQIVDLAENLLDIGDRGSLVEPPVELPAATNLAPVGRIVAALKIEQGLVQALASLPSKHGYG